MKDTVVIQHQELFSPKNSTVLLEIFLKDHFLKEKVIIGLMNYLQKQNHNKIEYILQQN